MRKANQRLVIVATVLLLVSLLLLAQGAWAEEGDGSLVLTPVPPPAQPAQPPQASPDGYQNVPPNAPYWQGPQPPQDPTTPYYWWSYPPGWGDQGMTPPDGWNQPEAPYGWNQDQPYSWGNPFYWGYGYGWNNPYGWGDSYGWAQPNPYDYWSNPQSPYYWRYYPYPHGWGSPYNNPEQPGQPGQPYGNQPPPNWDPNQQYG